MSLKELMTALCLLSLCLFLFFRTSPVPVVMKTAGFHQAVACQSLETKMQVVPISNPACSKALHGPHEVIWVAPHWRP